MSHPATQRFTALAVMAASSRGRKVLQVLLMKEVSITLQTLTMYALIGSKLRDDDP